MQLGRDADIKGTAVHLFGLLTDFFAVFKIIVNAFMECFSDFSKSVSFKGDEIVDPIKFPPKNAGFKIALNTSGIPFVAKNVVAYKSPFTFNFCMVTRIRYGFTGSLPCGMCSVMICSPGLRENRTREPLPCTSL